MPFTAETLKLPIHEQISEIQRKIQLLEGDRSAYYESSQANIKKNRETILQLRKENKKLHRKLADGLAGDEHVIKDAFQGRGTEKAAFRNMSGKEALNVLDQKVCSKMKRLNSLKHTTHACRRRLGELRLQYQSMKPESRGLSKDERRRRREDEEKIEGAVAADPPQQNLCGLENRLEKAQLKCQEAEYIMKSYLKLKAHLQEESLTYQSQLDCIEAEILKQRQELQELQVMNNDTNISKDAAKQAELQHQEELAYRDRKAHYKKQTDERKAHAEKTERRAQRAAMQPDELSSEAQRSTTRVGGEEEKALSSFEDAFRRIKEATGVTDTREVVDRLISQGNTHKHLKELKVENEKSLLQLKKERDQLHQRFQDMKYSGEAKLSSGRKMLTECEQHLRGEQKRRDAAKERLAWLSRTLNTVRIGVEHMADKLQHIKLPEGMVAQLPPEDEEYVVELLSQSEQKLLLLQNELQGKDLAAVMKEMEEEEFNASIEGKLPQYNTRIELPGTLKVDPSDDDDYSGEDERDIISRDALKYQSQQIIDSKTKRKPRKKKKGKF